MCGSTPIPLTRRCLAYGDIDCWRRICGFEILPLPATYVTSATSQHYPLLIPGIYHGNSDGRFLSKKARARNGLPSMDRNNKATLPFTGPRAATKSYAKASTPGMVKLQDAGQRLGLPPRRRCRQAKIQGQRPIRIRLRYLGRNHRVLAWILT